MINKIIEISIDEVLAKYKEETYKSGENMSQFLFESTNKKDLNKDKQSRIFFVNLDNFVREQIKLAGLKNGVIICTSKHTTSSVYVNHFEVGVMNDLNESLRVEYPVNKKYEHNIWDNEYKNADAHLKAIHIGKGQSVLVKDGEMILGDFENLIYAEFDARPGKSFALLLMGE